MRSIQRIPLGMKLPDNWYICQFLAIWVQPSLYGGTQLQEYAIVVVEEQVAGEGAPPDGPN